MVPRAEATGEVEVVRRPGPALVEGVRERALDPLTRPAPRCCLRSVRLVAWTSDVTGAGAGRGHSGRPGHPTFCTRARALVSRAGLALALATAS
jgi:hypothetical protein